MKLYFVRHASAEEIAASDAARELTSEGRAEARVAGQALAKSGVKPSHVFSSPLVRARQTAGIIAKELAAEPEVLQELTNDTPSFRLWKAIESAGPGDEVILVGHMPSLAGHVAQLIGTGNAEGLAFGKGAVALVEATRLQAGGGKLRWLMRQKQLREQIS
jgi:phosphohistidine phosphatase